MDPEFISYAALRIKQYMDGNQRSKEEIVSILLESHSIPVTLTMRGFFEEYFVRTLLNPDAETTGQGTTQIAPTLPSSSTQERSLINRRAREQPFRLMGTAENIPRGSGESSSSLHVPIPTGTGDTTRASQVPPETGDALIPVQYPLSSKTEILKKISTTLVEMKSEIVEMKSKQDEMLRVMSRKRKRDERDQGGQPESGDEHPPESSTRQQLG